MIDSGSPSLRQSGYWWYRVRADLLERAVRRHLPSAGLVLDVGSADAPSAGWLSQIGRVVAVDLDVRGLRPGGICGSAEALPFASGSFDVIAAFDVIEHCANEVRALAEVRRVLRPGGVAAISVPAYQWAWTDHDVHNEHHRRYTRKRAVVALEEAGLEVLRASYMFTGTFPLFAADRLLTRMRERLSGGSAEQGHDDVIVLPAVSAPVERLLVGLSGLDRRLIRTRDLPFGSSVVCVVRKP